MPPFALSASNGNSNALFILTTNHGMNFQTNVITQEGPRDSKTANYAPQTIMNRSSDVLTYSHSGNLTLNVTIELFAIQEETDVDKIQAAMMGMQSLLHPIKSGIQGPPVCTVTIGGDRLFQEWQCLCASMSRGFIVDAGFSNDLKCRAAACTLSFIGIEDDSVDAKDVMTQPVDYKDPDWYSYTNFATLNPVSLQSSINSVLGRLSQLGVTVGSGGVTVNTLAMNVPGINAISSAFGMPQAGGALKLNF